MYPVFEISEYDQLEQLGTKRKFWFYDDNGHQVQKKLCKEGREGTGENWAEKIACELAVLLGIPTANYDLAMWRGKQTVTSASFVPENGRLVHGNELLATLTEGYDEKRAFELKQYRLSTVIGFWQLTASRGKVQLPLGFNPIVEGAVHHVIDVFVAYLLFDCWIGNQDRHDQNWGIVLNYTGERGIELFLAPSFDHASSLSCRMSDQQREQRLITRDTGYSVAAFAQKANTPFYSNDGKQRLSTLDCFQLAATLSKRPQAIRQWLDRLGSIGVQQIRDILMQTPEAFGMSEVTVEFTVKYLEVNKQRLLGLGL